jgi:hypothetical protein
MLPDLRHTRARSGERRAGTVGRAHPNASYHDGPPHCPAAYPECGDDGYLLTAPIFALNHGFDAAFDAWNETNPAGQTWTLQNGGFLDATLDVTKFRTQIQGNVGGVEIDITFDYNGADRGDFFWTQGVFWNYVPPSLTTGTPYFSMDKCPPGANDCNASLPLYPYQYPDQSFYDKPMGPFPNGFFNGFAYPAKIDRDTRVLTVYEGIAYGFQLSVPEPGTWILMLCGLGLVLLPRLRS